MRVVEAGKGPQNIKKDLETSKMAEVVLRLGRRRQGGNMLVGLSELVYQVLNLGV